MLPTQLASWPCVPFNAYRTLPRISAVYACGDDTGRVLYVGSSVKLRARWSGHDYRAVLTTMVCTWIAWEACAVEDLQAREGQLIALLMPVINSRPPTRPAILPRIACTCQQCGIAFDREQSEARRHKASWYTYCSVTCRLAAKGERIAVVCQQCQKPFTVKPSVIKYRGGKYCSEACSAVRFGGMVTLQCATCDRIFQVKPSARKRGAGTYCSRACYIGATGAGIRSAACMVCGTSFTWYASKARPTRQYCSRECYFVARQHTKIP